MNPPPDALARLVAEGCTSLDRRMAAARGITPSMLRRWTTAGHLEPLGYGIYLIRTASTATTPWERERERHFAVATAVLDAAPTASVSGPSAVLAHGLPLLTIPTHVAIALRPHARCARRHVVVHRPWGAEPVDAFGLRAQPVAHAVIETSARLGVEAGLVCADAAARTGMSRGELLEALDEFGQRTGVTAARAVVENVDGRRESTAESRAAYCFLAEGIVVRPQVVVTDEAGSFVARVDFLVEGTRLVIEIDGLTKYTDAASLRAEKQRQVALERLGYRVVRLLWRDLTSPPRVGAIVRREISLLQLTSSVHLTRYERAQTASRAPKCVNCGSGADAGASALARVEQA